MTKTATTTAATAAGEGVAGLTADMDTDIGGARATLIAAAAGVARCTARDVPSPCVSVCRIDAASGLCTGCLRTLDEITGWSRLADAGKRRVWRVIASRARTAPPP